MFSHVLCAIPRFRVLMERHRKIDLPARRTSGALPWGWLGLVGVVCGVIGAEPSFAGPVTLDFNSLPSAQGWSYTTSGPGESSFGTGQTTPIFSVDGTTLHQNSIGTGLGGGGSAYQYYTKYGVVDPTQPFTLAVRARVLQSERADSGGFSFGAFTGSEGFELFMDTATIEDAFQTTIGTNPSGFHDYRLEATPGVGYKAFVDGALLASGPTNPAFAGVPNQIFIGDATSGGNAQVDVTRFVFSPPCASIVNGAVNVFTNAGTSMNATFTPSFGLSLADAATACGFTGFDWRQKVEVLPSPNPFFANSDPTTHLTSPPSFNDPVQGGYTYPIVCPDGTNSSATLTAYPFYYDPNGLPSDCMSLAYMQSPTIDPHTLSFYDAPADPCLPGPQDPATAAYADTVCGRTRSAGTYLAFSTELVGILPCTPPFPCAIVSPPLFDWQWTSTFNGTSGSVATIVNALPVDPGSGTGGITLVRINGVPVADVPEPSTWIMVCTGLISLIGGCGLRKEQMA